MEAKIEKSQAKRRRIPVQAQMAIVWMGIYLFLKFFIKPPLPSSVIFMYMTMTSIGLLMYVSVYEDVLQAFKGPIVDFLRGDQLRTGSWRAARWVVLGLFPLLVGWQTYSSTAPSDQPPAENRTIHPAPPGEFVGLSNPVPNTPENVMTGKGLFAALCSPCHGNFDGKGPAARGFNPPPANFVDPGTIAQLQESYVFWRIKTGGVGLSVEGMPWKSAMPRWEVELKDEQIWKIIMGEYDGAGHKPRTWE
ncbi:MAG: putative Monoheme cytochrome c [Nitrospira sp.]|nr:MAG: putative Monoheme cytochrome c [Nitrospira sp.]